MVCLSLSKTKKNLYFLGSAIIGCRMYKCQMWLQNQFSWLKVAYVRIFWVYVATLRPIAAATRRTVKNIFFSLRQYHTVISQQHENIYTFSSTRQHKFEHKQCTYKKYRPKRALKSETCPLTLKICQSDKRLSTSPCRLSSWLGLKCALPKSSGDCLRI